MTLAELLGPPRTLTLAGREWAVAELTLADVAALESWAADQAPSPWEGLEAMDAEGDEGLRALAWLAETNGFTAEDVGRLTLAQYGAYVRQGEPRSFGKMLQPGEDYEERRARRQRLFGGGYASPPPPSSSPAPPGPP
jgi:hypothetical protein